MTVTAQRRSWGRGRGALVVLLTVSLAGCGGAPPGPPVWSELEHFDEFIAADARVLFVGAHPDDETLAGPLLAYACLTAKVECHLALFTRGEGGTCALPDQAACQDLGAVRATEMAAVADRYAATLHLGAFPNGPEEDGTDPLVLQARRATWEAVADPREWLAGVIAAAAPDLVITLDSEHGFTGHVEHVLASRLVTEILTAPTAGGGATPSVPAVFHVLNHFQDLESLTGRDPEEATEEWPLRRPCGARTCLEQAVEIATLHQSQESTVLALLTLAPELFDAGYLRLLPRPAP